LTNRLPTLSLLTRRLSIILALSLILAMSFGGLRSVQAACAFDYADTCQLDSLADDGDDDDGEVCLFIPAPPLLSLSPTHPSGEPRVFFFASLNSPPAKPPPIHA
jgi:hypothetical protein